MNNQKAVKFVDGNAILQKEHFKNLIDQKLSSSLSLVFELLVIQKALVIDQSGIIKNTEQSGWT